MGSGSCALVAAEQAVLKVNAGLKGMTLGPPQNSKQLCERWKQGRVHWERVMKTEQLTRIGNKMEGERERERKESSQKKSERNPKLEEDRGSPLGKTEIIR